MRVSQNRHVPRAQQASHNTVLMGPYDGVGGRRFIREIRIIEFMMINGFPFRERRRERESLHTFRPGVCYGSPNGSRDAAFKSIRLVQIGRKTSLREKEKLNYRNNI